MNDKMVQYLKLPVVSESLREHIYNLTKSKRSIVAIVFNHIIQNLELEWLEDHDKFMEIETIRMMSVRKNVSEDSEGNSVNDPKISFLPIGKEPVYTNSGKWDRKGRQDGKIGKTIRAFITPYLPLIGVQLKDKDIEKFVNDLKSLILGTNIKYKLVKGDDIAKYYHEDMIALPNAGGSLNNSCMRHERCQAFFDVYTKNPECELLIQFDTAADDSKIVGRAIVWNHNGKKYVDRRYNSYDMYYTAMMNYIKQQKWNYKTVNSYDDCEAQCFTMWDESANDYRQWDDVELEYHYAEEPEEMPYADTVKYWNREKRTLSNVEDEYADVVKLCCTDGGTEPQLRRTYCTCCGCEVDEDDQVWINDECYCLDCVINDIHGNYIAFDDAIKVYDRHGGYDYVHEVSVEDYAVNIDGTWYIKPGLSSWSIFTDITEMSEEEVQEFKEAGFTILEDENLAYKL
jgi:hypothetical protein